MHAEPAPSESVRRTAVSGAVVAFVALVGLDAASPMHRAGDELGTGSSVVARLVSPPSGARSSGDMAIGLTALAFLLVLILRRWPTLEMVGSICPILARRVATTVPTLLGRRLSISYRIGGRHGG